ncbi:peptide/nickel transport system substrate-binding protein [Desulfitobacterium sp. LBE]|uniref:ABC transporter substrate-binding protein n=1 Tax=Desulfitobacterium sp. LBE TaxID=884086 RepID=UPI001198FD27|nr:ABC transporter substrate-binding protein [Desulfitobacterium sp. LBE]TWH58122.1 peptide/nickel transport system substrate-binding protein [Desulfitobacterium sp. LBE]
MKKKLNKRHLLLVMLLTISMLVLPACSNNKNQSDTGSAKENVLTLGRKSVDPNFDVQNTSSANGTLNNVFSTLFIRDFNKDNKYDILPSLVSDYKLVNDTTWHFTLKKGIRFHNGDILTANDVKFSLDRVRNDPKLLRNSNFTTIQDVKVIDDLNFEIITKYPYPLLLSRLAHYSASILPEKYLKENGWDVFMKKPVGSGPFQVADFALDGQLVLTKFKDYFGGNVTDWDKIVFRALPEATTRVSELITGGVQYAEDVPPAEWDRVNNTKGVSIVTGQTSQVIHLLTNLTPGQPLADVRVRQAIDYAINDKQIVDKVLKGTGIVTLTKVTEEATGSDPKLYNTYRYDPEKAKQLLKEAGYEKGFTIKLNGPKGKYLMDTDVIQMIAAMLGEVGIKTEIEILESSRYAEVRDGRKFEGLCLSGKSNPLLDASQFMDLYSSKAQQENVGLYKNARVDELVEKAKQNMNLEERVQQYREIQGIIAQELPDIPLYVESYFTGLSSNLTFKTNPDRNLLLLDIKVKQK